jgi:hypothetical protein
MILTVAQNGLEPIAYLTAVLTKMPGIKGNESIDHLLPWNLTQRSGSSLLDHYNSNEIKLLSLAVSRILLA